MSDSFNPDPDQSDARNSFESYPAKPVLVEKNQNAMRRSLISLIIYGVFFYFLFDRNLAYVAAVLLVIIVHEMGHFLMMRLFDYSNVKIFIVPLIGAFTSGKKQFVSQMQLCLIILAGPIPGIIIGSVLFWLNIELQNETLKMLANSFLIINLLNCLPFHPLDGGRLIETLFFKENHLIRLVFGFISIAALLILFLLYFSPFLLIIPALIGFELFNENKHQKIRDYLRQEKINYFTDYQNLPDKNYWLIRDCLLFSFPKKYYGTEPGKHEYSALEPVIVQHINSILQVNLKFDLNFLRGLIILLIYFIAIVTPIGMYFINK